MTMPVGDVQLRDGRRMAVKVIEPPAGEQGEALAHFLRHKNDTSLRTIRARLAGRFARECVDRYFVGEVEGRLVGHAWYGLPRGGTGVGNFGHVYTEPECRGLGIAGLLVEILVREFQRSDGTCLLCSAGADAARIYQRFGFRFVDEGATSGDMALLREGIAPDFRALEQEYFEAGLPTRTRPGSMRDRHDCDRMFGFSREVRESRHRRHQAFIARRVPTFEDALFLAAAGEGVATVLESGKGSIVGHAFALNLGSPQERALKVLDFAVHPHYLPEAPRFVRETVALAGVAPYAFVPACDEEKLATLLAAGFSREYVFPAAFRTGDTACDLLMLRGA